MSLTKNEELTPQITKKDTKKSLKILELEEERNRIALSYMTIPPIDADGNIYDNNYTCVVDHINNLSDSKMKDILVKKMNEQKSRREKLQNKQK